MQKFSFPLKCCRTQNRPQWVCIVLSAATLISCSKSASNSMATASAPVASLACRTSVIDQGQKGSVLAVARGTYSDTKIVPNSTSPATAYVDGAAQVIKLSYWTGSSFATEPVSGDGGASFLRLAFLSNRTPILFWVLGANVKVAIRSAPLPSPGSWQAGIVDTGVAPRAIEASVNPLDQVAVTYLTDTAVTGRPKFLYCDAPCTSTSGFQTMTTNPYIENTNLTAAQTGTGSAWCKVSSSIYYPVATYGVTGNIKYAVCMNTLANCLNGANWTATSVVATGNISSKVYLDSATAGDVPKVVSLGAGGIVPYRMGVTSCASSVSAFSAGPTIGTATSGNLWMSLMKDPASRFHLVANEGTTSVRYYNTASTDVIGAWNGAGIIDTVTLAAAGAGGAALASLQGTVYSSYATNAVPYDIKFGYVNDYSQASTGATFTRVVADQTGDLQLGVASTQTKQISMASTSLGNPAVAYVDFSVGGVAGAKLKFAFRSGPTALSAWQNVILPDAINPQYPALRFDAFDFPWISYFDASTNRFYLATNSRTDGSGNWYTYEFPAVPSGAPIALPAANNTYVATYTHAAQTDIVVAAIDNNAASKGVRVSVFNSLTRAFSAPTLVDGLLTGALGAANVSVESDLAGNIAMVYQDLSAGRLKYAMSTNGGVAWSVPATVSGVAQGAGAQLRINPTTQSPGVAYYDQTNNAVYYASCSGTISTCVSSGWNQTIVEGAAGISGLAAGSSQMLATSLRYKNGNPYILYVRGQANDGNLLVSTPTNNVYTSTIVARGANGALPGTPALNMAVAGWHAQFTDNASGSFTGAYVGPGNWLYSMSCGD